MTRKLFDGLGYKEKKRLMPLQIYGFGNSKSNLVTKFASVTLEGNHNREVTIDFNIIENSSISKLPGVSGDVYEEFPHLLDHRANLSAPIPRKDHEVDAIIGLRDKPKIYVSSKGIGMKFNKCQTPCFISNLCKNDDIIEIRKTIFGDIIEGGVNTKIKENSVGNEHSEIEKYNENIEDSLLIAKDVPLDSILERVFKSLINTNESPDRSALQQNAYEDFKKTYKTIPQPNGGFRFQVKVTRLPDSLYPEKVNGEKITKNALSRYFTLENRLWSPRNTPLRKGVFERVDDLIKDKIIVPIGIGKIVKRTS